MIFAPRVPAFIALRKFDFLQHSMIFCFLPKQDVIWRSIRRFFNVMDVRWTPKQRRVLTGVVVLPL